MVFLENEDLKKCAEVSLLCYGSDKNGIDETKVEDWMEDIEFLWNDDKVVYVKDSEEPKSQKAVRIYFGFRGTDTSKFGDLCDDVNVLKSILSDVTYSNDGGKFHKGFKNRSKICLQQVLAKLEKLSNDLDEKEEDIETYEIIFCGHSLGGAAAAVSSIRLRTKKSKLRRQKMVVDRDSIMEIEGNDEIDLNINLTEDEQKVVQNLPYEIICVTFGAPSFGSEANQKYCKEKGLSSLIYNIIHINDPVPKILYKIPEIWKPSFVINAKTAIGNFKILFDDREPEECKSSEYKKVEDYIRNKDYKNTKDHHRIRKYLEFFSYQNYGNTALDIMTRTNNDLKSLKKMYKVDRILGEGSYGYVMKGVDINHNTEVAIKKIKLDFINGDTVDFEQRDNNGKIIESDPEIVTLKKIQHVNIVKMYDFCLYDESKIYLVLELCNCDLNKYINKLENNLDEHHLRMILKDCLLGLKVLHEANIIHRDIKPANILVVESEERNIFKIGDLGSTSQRGEKTTTMTVRGTKLYASPEINLAFSKDKALARLNPQTDIFSIAASMLYCGKREHPWTEHDLKSIDDKSIEGFVTEIFPNENSFKSMLQKMLKIDYKIRPKASELLEIIKC